MVVSQPEQKHKDNWRNYRGMARTMHAVATSKIVSMNHNRMLAGTGCVMTWPESRCPSTTIPDEVAHKLDFVVVLGGEARVALAWAARTWLCCFGCPH